MISALITFFIFSIYNAVGQQVDQKYAATFSKNLLIQTKLAILNLKIMCLHLHYTMKEVKWFNFVYSFLSTTTKSIFCLITTLVSLSFFLFIATMFPYFFFSKNAKNKQIRKNILPSHSTNNLKPKKFRCQSSIKWFYKGLPGKKGNFNMITYFCCY